ncbi:Peptidase, U7 family [Pseudomonas syringae pv. cerasicola]|uniref:Peptidase, U7 family n=2 Tax=Pseudomonas syringae group TaxID=136849 RepID=A0A0P9PAW0_PSESX|nr:Peptidase, U7 family [Pseudomonas syringae pv. cerasicola]RMS78666.1 Peptidase, U7 family [Pseudomonas savastanoi]RMS86547.1 Peptidase, U7 family [Pseudomonas savastanoi]RMT52419.1 Peptidase, U7 family [Pseudomonas savastanoi]SOS17732.1 putative membrane protein [Pseudomonas syringae pv. cerasicola]
MDFVVDYASFLAKTVTLVIAIVVVLVAIASMRGKGRRKTAGQLQVTRLNDFYKGLRERLEQSLLDKERLKTLRKEQGKALKKEKSRPSQNPVSMCWISTVTSRPRLLKACVMKLPLC